MKKNKEVFIYYSVYENFARDTRYGDNWEKWYDFLNEEDTHIVAVRHSNMKYERLQKLFNHPNPKFNVMRTRKIEVRKCFSKEPVTYIDYNTQLHQHIHRLLKETTDEEQQPEQR